MFRNLDSFLSFICTVLFLYPFFPPQDTQNTVHAQRMICIYSSLYSFMNLDNWFVNYMNTAPTNLKRKT